MSFDSKSLDEYLKSIGAVYKKLNRQNIIEETVNSITKGNIVGLFQGRMEFGPRALGGRSIIADPSNKEMQKILNMKIKFRESFRPFAPAILENYVYDWFQEDKFDTYMLFVGKIKQDKLINLKNHKRKVKKINEIRSTIPAVTHVDNSARVQIVSEKYNKFFYDLILCFFKKKNIPILVNTSFNVRGEPIVNSIEDAFKCFMGTKMDNLVIENFFLEKNKQPKKMISNYAKEIPLD